MKRKLTRFAAFVLSCLMVVPTLADQQSLTGYGMVVTEPTEGQYYVIQGHGQAGQVTYLYDNKSEKLTADALSDFPTGPEALKYVWTFEITDEGYAAKNLTTGRYIFIEGTSSGGNVLMQDSPAYFTIDVSGDNVGFKNSSEQYIDMNYNGVDPVTWSDGVNGSRILNIYEAVVEDVDDLSVALARLNTCFGIYEKYLPGWGSEIFEYGTEIGQYNYSEEDYNLFVNNLQLALDILNEEVDDYTVEMINEIIENIEKGYEAVVASLVELTIADGNYRIISALEWTNTERFETGEYDENDQPIYEEITTNPIKAMYATIEGKAMWANIDSTDCRYLWKMTNNPETGLIQMMNIATDGIMATCTQSAQATLAADSETEMAFEYIGRTESGKVVVNIKPSTGGTYAYLHCNGHGGGTGKANNIVGWTGDAGASQWILEPVSDEEVQELVDAYAPIKNHELLVYMFQEAIAETEAAIAKAKDNSYIAERSEGLITSTDQFSSPFTDPDEGSFSNVLSDDAGTFWHSTWHEGDKQNHDHYFHVAFAEPIEGNVQCFMRRRSSNNDHITNLGVYGTNDESALESPTEEGWTEIGSYDLSKNASSGQTIYSNPLPFPEGFQYLRFYIDGTTNNRGYGHFATFQLYTLTIDGNTQWSQMGEAATAIEAALAKAKEVDVDEIEIDDYNELKSALDAFKALLVDPSALAAAIEANKNISGMVAIGENPGFWSADSEVGRLANTIKEATTYLKSGIYTQAQVDAYAEAINNGAKDLFAMANPIEPGKWYAFQYDSFENYEAHGWNTGNAENETLGDLFENYAAPAYVEDDELVGFGSLEEIPFGQSVRFIYEDLINEMDQIAFRFVAQGDSSYVIQHKSGLYLNGGSRSTNLTLGLSPALFDVEAVGYGKVVIKVRDLKGQDYFTEPVYLHAQNAGHSLVTWSDKAVGSNSALYIVPIDDSDFDEGADVLEEGIAMNVKPNSMVFMCYPSAFSIEGAEIYAYQGAISESDTTANYAFNKVGQAEAGQPVLLVVGDTESFAADDAEEEPEQILINPIGTNFAAEPLQAGGVHGTYAYEWVDEGTVVVGGGVFGKAGNKLVLAEGEDNTDCTRDISANTGYIVYGENILKDASVSTFDLVITAGKPTINGDLNGDGEINIADAVTVLNAMASANPDMACDLNGDGSVDISDFVTILNLMAK